MARSKADTDAALIAAAEKQAAQDAALLEALKARDAAQPTEPPAQAPTLRENFESIVAMLADEKRKTRLSEATLVKAWELNLLWVIQNRQLDLSEQQITAQRNPFGMEMSGDGNGSVGDDLPVPNEVIGETPTDEE